MGVQIAPSGWSEQGASPSLRPPPAASAAMRALEAEIEGLRDADCNVLVLGETGTGKSVIARRIHAMGRRGRGPFVDVNCAGLSAEFVQSELFGHERGAFTGAYATTNGLLDAANGGTLFLDELGDMDLRVQPKLLKVLEEKRFRRIGDPRERTVDVRLVSATHCDLFGATQRGTFRADLYYRISTVTLVMPPLRERKEDLDVIAATMLSRMAIGRGLSSCAVERLAEHSWPGNLRELRSVLERALLRSRGDLLVADDFAFLPGRPVVVRAVERERKPVITAKFLFDGAGEATRSQVEKQHIKLALEAENGNVKRTARRLGMARSTLYTKLRLYAITLDTVRQAPASGTRAVAAAIAADDEPDALVGT